ncbi:MAG: hypothetical protein ACAI25_13260, partial [Planctomycetota bacterium]
MTTKSADIVLEDHVPYDRSAIWRIHDAYFAERGSKAWTEGEIPFYATSNYAIARQHARAIIALVRVLEEEGAVRPDETVCLLEVGA